MLVLSRKPGESIILNNDIRVTVVAVKGDRVRLGIQAPDHITVDREEVHSRRLEFVEVLVNNDDSAIAAIGTLPTKKSADDTLIH